MFSEVLFSINLFILYNFLKLRVSGAVPVLWPHFPSWTVACLKIIVSVISATSIGKWAYWNMKKTNIYGILSHWSSEILLVTVNYCCMSISGRGTKTFFIPDTERNNRPKKEFHSNIALLITNEFIWVSDQSTGEHRYSIFKKPILGWVMLSTVVSLEFPEQLAGSWNTEVTLFFPPSCYHFYNPM